MLRCVDPDTIGIILLDCLIDPGIPLVNHGLILGVEVHEGQVIVTKRTLFDIGLLYVFSLCLMPISAAGTCDAPGYYSPL